MAALFFSGFEARSVQPTITFLPRTFVQNGPTSLPQAERAILSVVAAPWRA